MDLQEGIWVDSPRVADRLEEGNIVMAIGVGVGVFKIDAALGS
jgi:hypothetical protein